MKSPVVAYDPVRDEVSFTYNLVRIARGRQTGKWRRDWRYFIKVLWAYVTFQKGGK